MPWTDEHLQYLKLAGHVTTADGKAVPVFELSKPDESVLRRWAKHFRNHYCKDAEIDALRDGTGLSRSDYLRNLKFPSQSGAPGPSIRAGDFAEILVSDYFNYLLGYWVPRTRYDRRTIRNESTKGSDLLAFKFVSTEDSPDDILAICEAKAQFSIGKAVNKLDEAVSHSVKDVLRKAESLNAIKQRFIDCGDIDAARKIKRFQNPFDNPYKEVSGAAALFTSEIFHSGVVAGTDTSSHPNCQNLVLLIVKGQKFMALVHDLYERAANEA